jgi:hypothetical protein
MNLRQHQLFITRQSIRFFSTGTKEAKIDPAIIKKEYEEMFKYA